MEPHTVPKLEHHSMFKSIEERYQLSELFIVAQMIRIKIKCWGPADGGTTRETM